MQVLQPTSMDEAVRIKAELPHAVAICGGTDLMVELNFDRRRPEAMIDLTRVPELTEWSVEHDHVLLGASVTYTRIERELAELLPGLALASRTVGSPQIRNRGTVAGNLATGSPAGDALPPLVALDAQVELVSEKGSRRMPVRQFLQGPKKTALAPDELIAEIVIPTARGPQQFSKIGTRNAMVIAVASFALTFDAEEQIVGTGIGSAGPTTLRALEAEQFLGEILAQDDAWQQRPPLTDDVLNRFAELAGSAARPIDDVRGSADYRRHAVAVMAGRTLAWCWDEYRRAA